MKPKQLWEPLAIGDLVTSLGLEPADGFTDDNPIQGIVVDLQPYQTIKFSYNCSGYVSVLWSTGIVDEYDIDMLQDIPDIVNPKILPENFNKPKP